MKKAFFSSVAILATFVAACATSGDLQSGSDTVLITADDLATTPQDGVLELDLDQGLEYVIDYSTPMDFGRVLLVSQGQSVTLDRWLEDYQNLGFDYRDAKSQQFAVTPKPAYTPKAYKGYGGHDCDDDDEGCETDVEVENDNEVDNDVDNDVDNENESDSDSDADSCSGIIGCIDIL